MTPEQQSRLNRQASLGKDNGMRMRLTWESGFTIVVRSWEAAGAIVGKSGDSMRQYWYKAKLAEGLECRNPDNNRLELCQFYEEVPPRRGPPVDPERAQRLSREATTRRALLDAKITLAKANVAKAQARLQKLETQREQLSNSSVG